ncbi:MAG: hypothetical protein SGI88_16640 [Candidatus Hydrogenedentes bacterium]|nr:hypothetical protein [Candidatus Hydrogenedentota bacterium]
MTTVLVMAGITLGAIFELHSIPLEAAAPGEGPSPALTFFAHADSDAIADLFVLEGTLLTVVSRNGSIHETVLPHGVSVFDVADIDGDGTSEVIAVQRRAIFRIPLALQGATIEASRLFDADTLYASAYNGPMPSVLVVEAHAGGAKQIALPTASGIEYRNLDGSLVNEVPYGSTSTVFSSISNPIESKLAATGLSIQYYSHTELVPDAASPDDVALERNFSGVAAIGDGAPDYLLWFMVNRMDSQTTRAYWYVDEIMNTVIRIADVPTTQDGVANGAIVPGPERRYAGALVNTGEPPADFNGDGFTDILLWNAPRPGISVDSLLRAVTGRNWPITLTAHLYSPDKGRYEPAVAASFEFRIPVTWFLAGDGPLRHQVLADFNGDGKTDLGMCTEEDEFGVWLFDDGFRPNPDEKHAFPESITGIEHITEISSSGKTSIVLRGDKRIYALYAN